MSMNLELVGFSVLQKVGINISVMTHRKEQKDTVVKISRSLNELALWNQC